MANDDDTRDTRDAPDTRSTHRGDRSGDYEVGYGRPPKETRFRPGQTGNPRGRPKRAAPQALDLAGTVAELCEEQIELRLGGQPVRMPAREAMAHQIVNRAIKGEFKAVELLDKFLSRVEARKADQIRLDGGDDLSETDHEVVARALRRMRGASDYESNQGGNLQ